MKKKLLLRKESIRNLANSAMTQVNGGAVKTEVPWNCVSLGDTHCTATLNCITQTCNTCDDICHSTITLLPP